MADYNQVYFCNQRLLVLGEMLADQIGQRFNSLVALLAWRNDIDKASFELQLSQTYALFFQALAEEAELYQGQMVGNAWQNHVLDRLLNGDNLLARKVRQTGSISTSLRQAAQLDLRSLQTICMLDMSEITREVANVWGNQWLPKLSQFQLPSPPAADFKHKLLIAEDWAEQLDELLSYYQQHDPSPFAHHHAFKWRRDLEQSAGGTFEPVLNFDRQQFEYLVGQERERGQVIANTEQFLAGVGANHVLLYGARGTGKSATVKALLSRYAEQGLRLIEVHKGELGDYPRIIAAVRDRPEKFILFVDDLSFEADEFSYKDLKALLEGSLEARPANLLIYATSNRRHLIKEQFSDNATPGDEEINAWDTVEEKLSLSDRFGLIITFLAPNKTQYLAIVDALAHQAGIEMEAEDLHRRALRWELSHSNRSGRTARQFIDQLAGELALQARQQE